MTEQNLNVGNPFFYAEVRSVEDPDNAGKCKIVPYGHHNIDTDQIKEDELIWAHPMMNNTPSLNKVGETHRYLPGSTVLCAWADGNKQIAVILGSGHRAGLTKQQGSSSQNELEASGEIDGTKSSLPYTYRSQSGQQGGGGSSQDVVKNPGHLPQDGQQSGMTQQNTKKTDGDTNYGQYNDISNAPLADPQDTEDHPRKRAQKHHDDQLVLKDHTANTPTTASANARQILYAIQQVDSKNKSGVIANAVSSMIQLRSMDSGTTSGGLGDQASGSLSSAFSQVSSMFSSAMGQISQAASGATSSGSLSPMGQSALDAAMFSLSSNTSIITTDTGNDEIVMEEIAAVVAALTPLVEEGKLTADDLVAIINALLARLTQKNQNKVFPMPPTSQNAPSILPGGIGSNILQTIQEHLPRTVLDKDKMNKAMDEATKVLGTAKKMFDVANGIFSSSSGGQGTS